MTCKTGLPENIDMCWQHAAMDKRCSWYAYIDKTNVLELGGGDRCVSLLRCLFPNLPTDIHWKDSMHERQPNGSWKRMHPELEVDAKVIVWCPGSTKTKRRHFSYFAADGRMACFRDGKTSFTAIGQIKHTFWDNYEVVKP